ncbi:DEAD/DEAH box helicase [Methyloglobulus sp.]|uniref:DEAD/DEAH box helicase n=1 Tax=Methyloglobulus sp. TaxID=2518622 RepID=UPI0039897C92
MDTAILDVLTKQLTCVLKKTLPNISTSWWESRVLDKLSFQQQLVAKQEKFPSLEQLDLAALLRIVDQNWFELSQQLNLEKSTRNWLKEAQTIRNRWAHAPAGGLDNETRYRDLDTIERLLQALGANQDALNTLREAKKTLLNTLNEGKNTIPQSQPAIAETETLFKSGDIVRLKAQPAKTGAVVSALPGNPENRYQVFHDGTTATYYESQLELAETLSKRKQVSPYDLHAAMTALQLRHPSTSHLYSLRASRINFVPYQFRPVLKLIQSDRPRLLIADEVGVGKTIEAGLILKELQARREIKSVLIICPKPLVSERKWLEEMKRFDERFEHLDGKSLRYCIDETHLDGVWPQKYARVIVPYSLFDEELFEGNQQGHKKQNGLRYLDPPPTFDLVIVDEAHAIRNTDTWTYQVVRHFCENAEAVLLLSATPIQLRDNDLFTLLHLLRPDVITSRQDFDHMSEPNPHINIAIEAARGAKPEWKQIARNAIDEALVTSWGKGVLAHDPRMQNVYDVLTDDDESPQTRLMLTRQLEGLYTFSPFINRTRRRDIDKFTTRKPETVTVEFTTEQAELHTNLIDLIARMLAHRHGNQNLKFMLSNLRSRVASCVFGLAPFLESMLQGHLSQLEPSELDQDINPDEISATLAEFRTDVDSLIRQAQAIKGPDPKLDAFLKIIRDKQKLENNKLLVFSSFRHTLSYLIEKLSVESVRIGLIHGDIPDDERRDLRNRFSLQKENSNAIDVLLSSEVGCEGLDYQFCDGMVNYDLPWNPMRVEQRIGRIDRYGQESQTVVIYNFITPGTVEADIYERCLLRIGVFNQALGGSEEILGRLTHEIKEIAENFELSDEEREHRLQQIADNEVRVIQEQAKLEEEQSKLFGLSQPKRDEDMIKQADSFWLVPIMLANLIKRYLNDLGVMNIPASLGNKATTTLQLGQDSRNKLLEDFKKHNFSGEAAQSWSRWLKGDSPYLELTFNQKVAAERRDLPFITPAHPLAQQAALSVEPETPLECNFMVYSDTLPVGQHPYAIYRWQKLGLKEDFTFQPICTCPELTNQMLALLEAAEPLEKQGISINHDNEQTLERVHYNLWLDTRAAHIEQVQQHTRSRLDSLNTTHAARIAVLEEQRDENPSDKIQRMRTSQIASANRDYQKQVGRLEQASKRADILAEAVAFGVLEILQK